RNALRPGRVRLHRRPGPRDAAVGGARVRHGRAEPRPGQRPRRPVRRRQAERHRPRGRARGPGRVPADEVREFSAMSRAGTTMATSPPVTPGQAGVWLAVTALRPVSATVLAVTLPAWDPGAHIDVVLPNGLVRQYSLCGDPTDGTSYQVAVLRDPHSRGAST